MAPLVGRLRRMLWAANGYFGKSLAWDLPQHATVLVTYYNPARLRHIGPQVRNILKCNCVDRLVVSSHNPEISIRETLGIHDERVVAMEQRVRRGCGHRWFVARNLDPEFLIVIDDDMLLYPSQLARLFGHLVSEPGVPHGVAGMVHLQHNGFVYREREDMAVDYLTETYAVTSTHLKRYVELAELLRSDDSLTKMIQTASDFVVISQTGQGRPRIHNVGRLLRSPTFKEVGVAVHKGAGFNASILEVSSALKSLAVPKA